MNENPMKTEFYIATHKNYEFPKFEEYIPIQVGRKISKSKLEMIGDDTGDNISNLNSNFCELTALYWIWKNSTADIIGLVHYRRHFVTNGESNYKNYRLLLEKDIIKMNFKKNTIVVPSKGFLRQGLKFSNVEQLYRNDHISSDWSLLKNIISIKYPEYLTSFQEIEKSYRISLFNMMICHKEFLDKYCHWLFDILFELQQSHDISKYDTYQSRVYGFLSERLLNVFINKHKDDLDIQYIRAANIEDNTTYTKFKRKFIYKV